MKFISLFLLHIKKSNFLLPPLFSKSMFASSWSHWGKFVLRAPKSFLSYFTIMQNSGVDLIKFSTFISPWKREILFLLLLLMLIFLSLASYFFLILAFIFFLNKKQRKVFFPQETVLRLAFSSARSVALTFLSEPTKEKQCANTHNPWLSTTFKIFLHFHYFFPSLPPPSVSLFFLMHPRSYYYAFVALLLRCKLRAEHSWT